MSWLYGLQRAAKKKKQKSTTPPRCKQSKIPKKPRFEPKIKVIPGDHPVVFQKAKEVT